MLVLVLMLVIVCICVPKCPWVTVCDRNHFDIYVFKKYETKETE